MKILITILCLLLYNFGVAQTKKSLADNDQIFELFEEKEKGVVISYTKFLEFISNENIDIKCDKKDNETYFDIYINNEPIKVVSYSTIFYYPKKKEFMILSKNDRIPQRIVINWHTYLVYNVSIY